MDADERRSWSASIPSDLGVTRERFEQIRDERDQLQAMFNLTFGFAVGVLVGVIWEVLRRR